MKNNVWFLLLIFELKINFFLIGFIKLGSLLFKLKCEISDFKYEEEIL